LIVTLAVMLPLRPCPFVTWTLETVIPEIELPFPSVKPIDGLVPKPVPAIDIVKGVPAVKVLHSDHGSNGVSDVIVGVGSPTLTVQAVQDGLGPALVVTVMP
jgi:hypothetical protein